MIDPRIHVHLNDPTVRAAAAIVAQLFLHDRPEWWPVRYDIMLEWYIEWLYAHRIAGLDAEAAATHYSDPDEVDLLRQLYEAVADIEAWL